MTDSLRVALVQWAADLDPAVNRVRLGTLPRDADLIVLPEAFARDFGSPGSDISAFAEATDGAFATEVHRQATARDATVVAGMFEQCLERPDHPWNTLVVRGAVERNYRKIHLYDSFGYRESDRLSAGPVSPAIFSLGGFTVGLQTCYDLRFPELSRALVDAGADILVCPAAWVAGEPKVDHWRTLARARAIENTVYVVATGQPAPRYAGHSLVVDPLGDVVAEGEDDECVLSATLLGARLEEARRINPSLANRRLAGPKPGTGSLR